ncbi:MAG: FeoB-associated Cys-rich membrane protein [Firmicutes bacterium]|nr:FeoB-associated Cys-rich membrane protein [Bacillota bacterium]
MSIWDILLIALVAVIVLSSAKKMKKNANELKNSTCGGGCSGCSVANCPSKQLNIEEEDQ